ncbi:hypothetical protein C8J55DRAFT_493113 [Lentinula edodes]|uniref:BRCT domain-containing protein n=1 Tax=Lentinula lateritia TaxID=40482 RepID=A0A9W9DE97_9AGAR|nr:hypothetical protein C8J55DRAFT_493113 [Lentinula edodes]
MFDPVKQKLPAKGTKTGSVPSSPTKFAKSHSMFSYVPVMPHLINSNTSALVMEIQVPGLNPNGGVWMMSNGQDTLLLYIDIARNLGARVVKRIGPQYKKKRLKVIGASWLRDCKQVAAHLDEEYYLVNLEEHKLDLTCNSLFLKGDKDKQPKRCQLYIPKFSGTDDNRTEDGDISVDCNTSKVNDEITPLARAQLRQNRCLASLSFSKL